MLLERTEIPPGPGSGYAVAFPGPSPARLASVAAQEPVATLSFASAGDMKYGDHRSAGNRAAFLRRAGFDPDRVQGMELSHSRTALLLARGEDAAARASAAGGADGIILRGGEGAASVTVADCMPIWLLDRGSGSYGILHSGWRGTGILETAIRSMVAGLGSDPASISVVLGPAIGACCYAVAEERAQGFASEFGPLSARLRDGRHYLDLRAANIAIARRMGVGYLLSIDACTSCDGRLGSYRRQGAGAFVRMLAVCGRPAGLAGLGLLP